MMKRLLFFSLLAAFPLLSCSPQREDIIMVDGDDAEMNAAIAEGRKTFGIFVEAFQANPEFGGLIKVYFKEDGANGEHMWVHPLQLKNSPMTGILVDTPGWLTQVKPGDRVSFSLDEVTDWMFVKEGKAVGAYSVRLLRNRMTESERKKHDAAYPFTFD